MVRRSARILVEVLGTIVAGIAILVAVTAWRLSQGPITLSLLTPYVEEALSAPDRGFIVRIDRTVLAWGGWERTLDLEGVGIHVIDPAGQPLLTLPEISLRLSARALIEGVVAPTSLEVSGAQLHLRRNAEGRFNLEFADQSVSQVRSNVLPAMLEDMLRRPDRERPISFLRRITITNANLVVEGSRWDTSWKAQLPRLVLERDAAGLRAAAVLDLHVQDLASHFDARGLYNATTRTLSLDVAFGGLNPATVAQAAPELAPMAHFSLPFAGKIHVQFEPDGSLGALNFDVSAGEGRLVLRELYSADLDVKSLAAKGALAEHGTALTLDEADIDLGGTTFTLHGTAHEIDGNSTATLDVVGKGVKVDDLPKLWPASVAGNPRAWITANLSAGMVDDLYASIEAHGHGPDFKDLDFDRVNGSMRLSGIDVRYLEKMPKVRGAGGEVHFDEKSFNIAIDKGGAEGLAVDSGTIAITGLDGEDQRMAIDLALHGPLVAAAQLADHEPLHYVSKLGLDPKKMAGDSVIRLVLKFPLLHDLRLAQIDASASGDMKNISMASMFMGHDLSRGNVALKVDKAGMQATGEATIGPVPVSLSWSETFGRLPERRIRLAGDLDDQARKTLGLDAPGILRGPVHAELDLKGADHGPTRADLALDLTKARLRLPEIDWRKLPGATGKAHATLILSGEKLSAIPDFAVEAPDLALHGEVSFDAASGAFSAARLDRLAIFRDRLAVAVTRRPDDGYAIELRGDAFDAAPFLKDTGNEPKEPGATLAIALGVKRLWLSQSADVPLSDASATIDYDGRRASRAVFDAKTASGAPFHLEIVAEDGKRRLAISTDNAGDVLRAVDFADNVVGGKLRIAGTYDDTKADPPLSGTLRMTDFKLLQAPFPVKLLTVTSPADAGERLSGEGIGFSALIAPFTRTGTRVAIKDGRTVGSELGLTFEGWLDPDANQLRIEGTIVPIYTLNSLLGNIPGLNEVLVGPKGGGTFAATYVAKGKLDDPDVTVNPLSALAPGILRELVRGLFGGGSDLTPEPSDQVKPMQGGG